MKMKLEFQMQILIQGNLAKLKDGWATTKMTDANPKLNVWKRKWMREFLIQTVVATGLEKSI